MSATPPEASTEYSRGVPGSRQDSARRSEPVPRGGARGRTLGGGGLIAAIVAGVLIGALLLLVAEFTTLFEVRTAAAVVPVRSVGTGSHHGYALVPIALLAALFALAVWSAESRPALLAIGVLGILALLIALLGDLPDAKADGLVFSAGHYLLARSSPSAGFYMETLGAVVLVIACASGFLLMGPPRARRRRRPAPGSDSD